ncbi:MAG: threonine synthase [Sphingobacteriales bacterium]|nr:threonine synthase [Sphingobacteriales bacterium]
MLLYSTRQQSPPVTLQEAVLRGLAPDQGLYLPEKLPAMPADFWENLPQFSFPEASYRFASQLLQGAIPENVLQKIVYDAVNFDAPLRRINERISVLELFHGPSLAFKDFGARFMARLMGYFVRNESRELHILVATSGDTGGAVAMGFWNTPHIRVTILYPSGKVSPLQEKQLTTLGGNVSAVEVQGTFDDCQRLVKAAFSDKDLQEQLFLSSANSINIARLIPQAFYYIWAYRQLQEEQQHAVAPVFCTPSGNFGNLSAGIIAQKMGLPVRHFVAATNANDVVAQFLSGADYMPRPSLPTLSNAMDVGNPSNFERMQCLYHHDTAALRRAIAADSVSDTDTLAAMRELYQQYNYVACPHTAVAYRALVRQMENRPDWEQGIFLSTAHPAKFIEVVEEALGIQVALPPTLERLLPLQKEATLLSPRFEDFKEYLWSVS